MAEVFIGMAVNYTYKLTYSHKEATEREARTVSTILAVGNWKWRGVDSGEGKMSKNEAFTYSSKLFKPFTTCISCVDFF